MHVHVFGIRKNKARETEILRTASASRREEVDNRVERGGGGGSGEGEEAFPAVHPFRCHSMSIFPTLHSICIKR